MEALALMQRVEEFLQSDGQVFLILGDLGAGKSTFNRYLEHKLWTEYKPGGDIPLFINLPAVAENYRDIIGEQLQIYKFPDHKVKELKENRKMILICDGYDETQLKVNLHSENMFNQKGQADVKMIISCRSTVLQISVQMFCKSTPSSLLPRLQSLEPPLDTDGGKLNLSFVVL